MITQNPSFQPPPNPDVSIWRYMDLAKFLSVLQRKALFFARADKLGDPFEGHFTEAIANLVVGEPGAVSEEQRQKLLAIERELIKAEKKRYFVNCWHMNDEESAAMWKLYTPHNQSVCIKSSYRLLAEQLPEDCYLGCAKYINYRADPINPADMIDPRNFLNYINHKRRSLEYEKELRAVIWDRQTRPRVLADSAFHSDEEIGKFVPIVVDRLIVDVRISPEADDLLLEVVRGLCERYELSVSVYKSGINAPPAY